MAEKDSDEERGKEDMSEVKSPVLKTENLTIQFGGLVAVDKLNLEICEGDIYGLIGPNGAGKTTVFNMVMGYYQPTSGTIRFQGENIVGLSVDRVVKKGISRTFQNIRLFTELTVLENVLSGMHVRLDCNFIQSMLGLNHYAAKEKAMEEKAVALLTDLGLGDKLYEYAGSLPYGLQRKLEIARALASDPALILLDEPAAGMNPQEIMELDAFIRSIRDKYHVTVFIIEHHMSLVMNLCNKLTVLSYGETIASGKPEEVQNDPVVISAYLGTPNSGGGN